MSSLFGPATIDIFKREHFPLAWFMMQNYRAVVSRKADDMDQKAYDAAIEQLKQSDLAKRAGIIDHDMVMRFLSIDTQVSTRINVTKMGMSNEEMLARMNGEIDSE